jgi:hypothetical protein
MTRPLAQQFGYAKGHAMTANDGNGSGEGDFEDFIDPKGYWADFTRNIRRTSLKQEIVLTATKACTAGEWMFLLDSLGIAGTAA